MEGRGDKAERLSKKSAARRTPEISQISRQLVVCCDCVNGPIVGQGLRAGKSTSVLFELSAVFWCCNATGQSKLCQSSTFASRLHARENYYFLRFTCCTGEASISSRAMAATGSLWASPLPRLSARFLPSFLTRQLPRSNRLVQILAQPLRLPPTVYAPGVLIYGIPSILAGLWESILRAVPKKKTSHMKKRHRQLAGKALQDLKNVTKCPGCGQPKRPHLLCPTCVTGKSIRMPALEPC